jgi:D-3-phosphoglycerate dehydrogenase
MPQTIALTAATMRDDNNEVAQTLLADGYQLRIHPKITFPTRDELRDLLRGAVGVIAGSEQYSREVMEEAADLRIISRNGVGYDAVDLDAATDLGIVVAYVPDAMVDAVADLTMGLLLAAARNLVGYDAALKRGEWLRLMSADVSGKTLGLIGTGRIGMAVARRARAFRMRLVAHDPYVNPLLVEELGADYLPLEELLAVSDFVSLHTPGGSATRALIGAPQLAQMKPSAYLINCARGSLIDEPALLAALDEGRLAGAAVDVYAAEPPPPGSDSDRLARHPKVVGTPHIASFTPVTAARMGRAAMENMLALLQGGQPEHVANPAVFERGLRG